MTSCSKAGVRIQKSDNDYKADPFAGWDFSQPKQTPTNPDRHQTNASNYYESLDLDINNYQLDDLYNLFGLNKSYYLTEEALKTAKKIVLKTHPDKSRLDPKYMIFFNQAYERLKSIYDHQNKRQSAQSTYLHTQTARDDDSNHGHGELLNAYFEQNKHLKKGSEFNQWFNEQFEKHRVENPLEQGYGDWLKSDEDIDFTSGRIHKNDMAREMEKRKKVVQEKALMTYTGVSSTYASTSFGGSSLMELNGSTFDDGGNAGYSDLKQAYVESVIPVTEEDFHRSAQYRNVEEYKRAREAVNITPLSKEESMNILAREDHKNNEQSAAVAYYYAQQAEKAKQHQDSFWSSVKRLTNW